MLKTLVIKLADFIFSLFYRFFLLLKMRSRISFPIKLNGIPNFKVGYRVAVGGGAWLAAMPLTGENAKLVIEDGTCIGHFAHIYATKSIHIGKKVLIADKVYISDNLHGYEDVSLPIMDQPVLQKNPVVIGDETWIGEHVCIIGATIGKHCVIGANSVVTHNIPDYCVAVGSPAKVIKRYDFEQKLWVRC